MAIFIDHTQILIKEISTLRKLVNHRDRCSNFYKLKMRFLLEKQANFSDIERTVLNGEELAIESTIVDKFGKAGEKADTAAAVATLLEGLSTTSSELSDVSLAQFALEGVFGQRCTLYSLAATILQLKKKFTLEIMEFVVSVLNTRGLISNFNPTSVTDILQLFVDPSKYDLEITAPLLTLEQLKIIAERAEQIVYIGVSLYIFLLSKNCLNISLASFACYLEAVGCNPTFLEEIKALNHQNREFINNIETIETFFAKRNNKKGKATQEMLETTLVLTALKADVKELKFKLKDFVGGERNPTLKKTLAETTFAYPLWKKIGFSLQKLNHTLQELQQLGLVRVSSLLEKHFGAEVFEEQKGTLEALNFSSVIDPSFSYLNKLKRTLFTCEKYSSFLNFELGVSHAVIYDRIYLDKNDPKKKNKKNAKASFKLGEGSLQFLENMINGKSYDDLVPEGEGPSGVVITPISIPWWSLDIQAELRVIFSTLSTEARKPKVPKGVRDTTPLQMAVKNRVFDNIKGIFRKHGAVEIDTPVFELKETLMGKYGEEGAKLIYDLKDQGGELLSLRYDLTVPFARYVATNNIQKIKRFHIGKVYRRDQPNMNKGRFREFYQCDLDIAGNSGLMIADSEVLTIVNDIMTSFEIKGFEIKISHRGLLEAIIEAAGGPLDRFKTICSSIDKLDKEPWEVVANELINDKGIDKDVTEKLKPLVLNKGTIIELIEQLRANNTFGDNQKAAKVFEELTVLANYLKSLGSYENITLDLTLARGLDYYTGVIFEIVVPGLGIGSLGGGGRYDGLLGMFSGKDVPSIGLSFGVERLFVVLEEMYKDAAWLRPCQTHAVVTTLGNVSVEERLALVGDLWKGGIKAETLYDQKPKPKKPLEYALENKVPFILWLGEDEFKSNKVNIKVIY